MEKYTWQFISKAAEPMLHRIEWDTREGVPAGSHTGPEKRSLFLIECNVSGYGSVVINGKEFAVGPRCCYILYPGDTVLLKADHEDPKIALWCIFAGARVGEILTAAGITSDSPFAPAEKFDELFSILEKLHSVKNQFDMGSELMKTAYLYEFLGVLTRGKADIGRNIISERAIGIMETEYQRNISVTEIADELGFERSYFSTIFKERTGVSPYSYLTRLRIKKACDMLTDTELSISEIAERVGLDPHNFSRIFKRETGTSPVEYKEEFIKHKYSEE